MKAGKHVIGLIAKAVVIKREIRVEQGARVNTRLRHAFPARRVAEAAEYRVVYLYSPCARCTDKPGSAFIGVKASVRTAAASVEIMDLFSVDPR